MKSLSQITKVIISIVVFLLVALLVILLICCSHNTSKNLNAISSYFPEKLLSEVAVPSRNADDYFKNSSASSTFIINRYDLSKKEALNLDENISKNEYWLAFFDTDFDNETNMSRWNDLTLTKEYNGDEFIQYNADYCYYMLYDHRTEKFINPNDIKPAYHHSVLLYDKSICVLYYIYMCD